MFVLQRRARQPACQHQSLPECQKATVGAPAGLLRAQRLVPSQKRSGEVPGAGSTSVGHTRMFGDRMVLWKCTAGRQAPLLEAVVPTSVHMCVAFGLVVVFFLMHH